MKVNFASLATITAYCVHTRAFPLVLDVVQLLMSRGGDEEGGSPNRISVGCLIEKTVATDAQNGAACFYSIFSLSLFPLVHVFPNPEMMMKRAKQQITFIPLASSFFTLFVEKRSSTLRCAFFIIISQKGGKKSLLFTASCDLSLNPPPHNRPKIPKPLILIPLPG